MRYLFEIFFIFLYSLFSLHIKVYLQHKTNTVKKIKYTKNEKNSERYRMTELIKKVITYSMKFNTAFNIRFLENWKKLQNVHSRSFENSNFICH